MAFIQALKENVSQMNVAHYTSLWGDDDADLAAPLDLAQITESTDDSDSSDNTTSEGESEEEILDDPDDPDDLEKAHSYLNTFQSCNCGLGEEQTCLSKIPLDIILPIISECCIHDGELSQFEKRILARTYFIPNMQTTASGRNNPVYSVHGNTICRNGFMFATNISQRLIESIFHDMAGGKTRLFNRPNWAKNRKGTGNKKKLIVNFLNAYSIQNGYPCPSAVRKTKKRESNPTIFLPRGTRKIDVYKEFVNVDVENSTASQITKRYFNMVWKKRCPYIKIMKNGSDYCDYCTKHHTDAKTDEDSRELLERHRQKAKQERNNYLSQLKDPSVPHYTFDFAQSVHLPFLLRQPGSFFFKKGLRVRIFGVCCETSKTQVNYLLPEGSQPGPTRSSGKGPNLVISLLLHFIEHYNTSKHIKLHADSCAGQNKNQYVFYFFIWCVIVGRLDSVTLSFMVPGHTKAIVDAFFGIFKSLMKTRNIKTLSNLCQVIRDSTAGNQAVNCASIKPDYYNWKEFLGCYFNSKGVPNIRDKILIMEVSKIDGKVQVKLKKDSEDEGYVWVEFLEDDVEISDIIKESGEFIHFREEVLEMSTERRKYLLEQILEPYYAYNDPDKIEFLGLNNQEEYDALRTTYSTSKKKEGSKKRRRGKN